MSARSVGKWYRVGEIISLFRQMGCDVARLPEPMRDDEQRDLAIRYIMNHETGRFVTITDLSDDDRVPEAEVEIWMRRLGVTIPLPPVG